MKSHPPQHTYFFDFPVADIYGIGGAALNLIYYGQRRGVFGSEVKDSVDLGRVDAFSITLAPRSEALLSNDFEYKLIYLRANLAAVLWENSQRKKHPEIKNITRRVEFNEEPGLEPHRLRHWYISCNRPIYVARYGQGIPTDDCVPLDYVNAFDNQFEGFLFRCAKDFLLEKEICGALGLGLVDRRDGAMISSLAPHVLIYSQTPWSDEKSESA